MKRSQVIHLSLVSSMAALLTGCASKPDRYCVDDNQRVLDPSYCQDNRSGGVGHRWYYGGAHGYVPLGTRLVGGSMSAPAGGYSSSPSETSRGGIGHAGEAASSHASGGHGGGE